jgi:type II secretory pathway component PulF
MEMSNDGVAEIEPAGKGGSPPLTRFRFIAHGVVWGIWLGLFIFGVPGIESILRDYNFPLPRAAVFVIWAAHQVIALIFLTLVLLGVDWFVLEFLSRRGVIDLSQTWSTLMFATPLLLIVLTLIAMSLPLFTSDFGLSG